MIAGIAWKVCGLTSAADAESAGRSGADYLGFNLYPASPRFLPLERYLAMAAQLPKGKRVAVMVEPSAAGLAEAAAAGFDYFQVHFRHDLPLATIAAWSQNVGGDRLWLAPRLPPEADVNAAWLPHAQFFLLDTFQAGAFGGSGRAGDWAKFSRHREAHPTHSWMLAGGLNPANIGEALRQSGARLVDANSGVESAPGVKDPSKLKAFAAALKGSG